MAKTILQGEAARLAIIRGVDFLSDAVKVTEGPRGRNVILGQRSFGQSPKVTKDGVTVANYCDPADPTEQMGSDLVREAAQKTDNAVGDGTTASITLAQSMIHTAFDLIKRGANPMGMERGIKKATDFVIERLHRMAIPVDAAKIEQVATVSAHGDLVVGKLVAEAIAKAGPEGVVTAEASSTADTYIETVAGIELPKSKLIHQAFITHPEDMKAELTDCRILLWEGVIGTAKSLAPLLGKVNAPGSQKPLLIVAGGYEAEVLAVIINNRIKNGLPAFPVRMEAFGDRRRDLMGDVAALIGGGSFTEDMGRKIDDVRIEDLGQARKVVIDVNKTQIIGGRGNQAELQGRVESIRRLLAEPGAEKAYLQKRLASLLGGITIIKVGGVTVTEMEEKRDRVIDAMSAAKAAVLKGIVPGGGFALLQASPVGLKLPPDERSGISVVATACQSVARQIAENAGLSGDEILNQLLATPTFGYNASSGEFEDLVAAGIIDPVAVVEEALKNAAAVSCSIITMGATIAEPIVAEKCDA